MSDCNSFITDPFRFPRRPVNRPALERIGYRIGAYPDFVEYLTRRINTASELKDWTHRAPDDPGIALLEGAAILGDILTFYQERYANEAFLRTARWRESVAELVRLLGYRLAPGVGGHAVFAFEVKGAAPLEIPPGFPVKVDLEEIDKPANFQTEAALTAYPYLSRLHLYRQRNYSSTIAATKTEAEIQSVAGSSALIDIDAVGLKKGDRLMLVPAEPSWTTSGSSLSTQKAPQVLKVKEVKRILDRTLIEFETGLASSWTAPVTAYRLGRSFHHFGHNALRTFTTSVKDSANNIIGTKEDNTNYKRHLSDHDCSQTGFVGIDPPGTFMPLDQEVNDLLVNARLIVQTRVAQTWSGTTSYPLTAVKHITGIRNATLGLGSLNGLSTFLTLDSSLNRNSTLGDMTADVRDYQLHEVTSPPLALQPKASFSSSAFSNGVNALYFFGTLDEAKTLAQRRLSLQHDDGRDVELFCTKQPDDFVLPGGAPAQARPWALSFDKEPAPFTRADFDESMPKVTVFGNLADATQGKAETEAVLGNGDARASFQTFKLPKAPLTYLLSSAATPPQVPELAIYVDGRRWERVDSFYDRGPLEELYVVREDAEGASYVQFGDGECGARLPSGIKNVKAVYRSGSGGHGPIKDGAKPSAGQRLERLAKVQLAGLVSGGADPEAADKARLAAPGKVQSLGRLVSLSDFETELLTIPGITSATASWGLVGGVPGLTLRVLLAAGREPEFEAVRATIAHYQRCRGPDRFAVTVEEARLRYLYLDLLYAFDPRLLKEDVETRVRAALGVVDDEANARSGLFGLYRRRLGEKEYASRIEGVVQRVEGVTWCKVTALGMFGIGVTDPATTVLPAAPRVLAQQLAPGANRLLQLHPQHLTLNSAPPAPQEECA